MKDKRGDFMILCSIKSGSQVFTANRNYMKLILIAAAVFAVFRLAGAVYQEVSSFENESWKKNWMVASPDVSAVKNTPQGVQNLLAGGKELRFTGKELLKVEKDSVIQIRTRFQGKSLSCGIVAYDARKKPVASFRRVIFPVPGGHNSIYYDVPAHVQFLRIILDLKPGVTLQQISCRVLDPKQQKSYFYEKTPDTLLGTFHSGEGRELPRNFTNMWNSGKLEIVPDGFTRHFTRTLKITSDARKDAGVRFNVPFPVKKGDCILVETVFKGSGNARIGIFGKGLFKAKTIPTVNRQWDKRQEIFEIPHDNCKKIHAFLAGQKGHSITYAYVRISRLTHDARTSFLPERLGAKWRSLTAGVNLAKGKNVTVFPAHKKNTSFLTDGKISTMTNLVFHSGALVWHGAMTGKHVRLIVDLGSVQKVGKAGIRISGGKQTMQFPRMLKIFVSKDGKHYYPAASLAKVTPAEADLTDWQNLYYLADKDLQGVTFTYPFVLDVNADARYVAFSVQADSYYSLVTDELAVIGKSGKIDDGWNSAYKKTPDEHFNHQSVKITPYTDKFYIAEGIYLPNLFAFDIRIPRNEEKFTYMIDLPSQVEFAPYKGWPPKGQNHIRTVKNAGRSVFHFAPDYTVGKLRSYSVMYYNGPFLFRVPAGSVIPEKERYAVITAVSSGGKIAMRYPLEILKFPAVKPYKRLKFGQMLNSRHYPYWPDAAFAWKTVGYNMIQFEVSPHQVAPSYGEKIIAQTEQQGLFRRAFSNPVCDMCYGSRRDKAELRCTSAVQPGKKWIGQLDFCPSYRGIYYREVLENIRKMVVAFKPHVIEFDDEAWNPKQLDLIFDCTRCQALRKEKKMDWKTFIEWAQADFLKGYYHAVKAGAAEAGIPMPDITHWPFSPVSGNYFSRGFKIMNHGFPYLFGKYANLATHFYYAQSVADQQKGIRKVLETVKDPKKFAMTVHGGIGCYRTGYMGKKTAHLFIDSVLNGTTHVLQYGTFTSPHDFYQMNTAIRLLIPHEDLLMDGVLDRSFTGSNKKLLYTKRTLGKRSLLLIGNYSNSKKAATTLLLRGKVTDCLRSRSYAVNGSYSLEIAPDDFALLLLEE